MNFIDYAKISVQGGDGGNGCIAFLREKFRPKGGPSGGDGGRGGNIIFIADPNLSTLHDLTYKKKYIAPKGGNGKGKNMHGKNGRDIFIKVPLGTIVSDLNSKSILVDLDKEQEFIIAHGGNGGFGNARFKTKNNTAPRIANDGQKGEIKELELELKVLADVGLVGFPNAGKSTFISSISNAKPKIADYPFTTLTPNLGILKRDFKTCVIADIPGIIKGASKGKGLGFNFLKHIDRTKILVFIIDINSEDINGEYKTLKAELKTYKKELIEKPHILFLSKLDVKDNNSFKKQNIEKLKYIEISSVSKEGLKEAKNLIFKTINTLK